MKLNEILLTIPQACAALGVTETPIKKLVSEGRVSVVQRDGHALIRLESLVGHTKKRLFSARDAEKVAQKLGQNIVHEKRGRKNRAAHAPAEALGQTPSSTTPAE